MTECLKNLWRKNFFGKGAFVSVCSKKKKQNQKKQVLNKVNELL